MRALKNEIIIFSVSQGRSVAKDKEASAGVLELLHTGKVPFKLLEGCYNGVKELSFLVPSSFESVVRKLVTVHDQESYFKQFADGTCQLVFRDGSVQELGELYTISKQEALRAEFYSLDLETGKYYVTGGV